MNYILVTGGRDYTDAAHAARVLTAVGRYYGSVFFVQGGARGADRLVRDYCREHGMPCATVAPCWDYYGNSAGSVRNAWMADMPLSYRCLLAFPGGVGTRSMINLAQKKGIPVYAV